MRERVLCCTLNVLERKFWGHGDFLLFLFLLLLLRSVSVFYVIRGEGLVLDVGRLVSLLLRRCENLFPFAFSLC